MPGSSFVIFDADGLVALFHESDSLHSRAKECLIIVNGSNLIPVVAYATVLEAATVLAKDKQIRRPDLAKRLLDSYSAAENPSGINWDVQEDTAHFYNPKTSRKNTPFDHYVLALAKKNEIKYVFSFDEFYKKKGLKLVEEMIQT